MVTNSPTMRALRPTVARIVPLLTQLVDVFANGMPARQVDALLREAGSKLAGELSPGRSSGTLRSRVMAASHLLNQHLGAVTHVEQNGGYIIRGEGCPLSAPTGKHPALCRAMESLVKEFVGTSVRECCQRAQRPRCCGILRRRRDARAG